MSGQTDTIDSKNSITGHDARAAGAQRPSVLLALTIGAIGVVYGDIGTSPIYAFRETLNAARADGALSEVEILGTVSLILWALILIVAVKYVSILLYADNRGEGGTLSLMSLARRAAGGRPFIMTIGIVATALFFGDAVITPAISVLSAVEGLKEVTPVFDPFILPITAAILVGLFAVQRWGTARVASAFGPITLVWFAALAASGVSHVVDAPKVLLAFNPVYGISYIAGHGAGALVALGAVFLAVTGAEALYADLGHFGRKPIKLAWFLVAMPALMLNYLGQAALVLGNPAAADNPFFKMVSPAALAPLVVLATIATIIASQAVITGAFSLSRQAIQLGLLPRLEVSHKSADHAGQIYMPQINFMLFVGCLTLVGFFRSSTNLAAAYGIAVTGTMIATSLLAFFVVRSKWRLGSLAAAGLLLPFLLVELVFFAANLTKFDDGGWFPMLLGLILFLLMTTWRRGSAILLDATRRSEVPISDALARIEASSALKAPGTAVFLTASEEFAPSALMHNLKHNKVLHDRNVIVTIAFDDAPRVAEEERVRIEPVSDRFTRAIFRVGYMESPNLPAFFQLCRARGLDVGVSNSSFFLSRRWLRPATKSRMPAWRTIAFIAMARNASTATDYFGIPTDRVIEIGTQVAV